MFRVIDTETGETFYIKDIRRIELEFTTVEIDNDKFILRKGKTLLGTLNRAALNDKTSACLHGLSEFRI